MTKLEHHFLQAGYEDYDLERTISPAEREEFHFDRFPSRGKKSREFIFSHTGFAAKPMSMREWYLFNQSLNHGYEMGLADDAVRILSVLDHSLSRVRRFSGMPHMDKLAADSNAAHSKQVAHVVDDVVRRAFGDSMPPCMEKFRKDAMLGAWIHDMGEIVLELTTASQVFAMDPHDARNIKAAKNNLERNLFIFACDLADYHLKNSTINQFPDTIDRLRAVALGEQDVLKRIAAMQKAIQEERESINLPTSDVGKHLLEIYDRTEEATPTNFLHPFVKTLECTEGQRYLQRNSANDPHTRMELAPSTEIVDSLRRCERRLPDLFNQIEQMPEMQRAMFDKLARQTAVFTYGSMARHFLPERDDHVSLAPMYVDRAPDSRIELPTGWIKSEHRAEARSRTQSLLGEQHAQQPADSLDVKIWNRAQAGSIYRAAEAAMMTDYPRFRPTSASLISFKDTPQIPTLLAQAAPRHRLMGTTLVSQQGRAA
jgi:hypothetical protein